MGRIKNRTDRKTATRLVVIFLLFVAAAAVVVGRLAEYQLKDHRYYDSRVLNQLTIQT
jgi:hypothetical protein